MAEIYDYPTGFDDSGNKNASFRRIIGTGKRVLEIGRATGYVGEHLVRQQSCRVYDVEYGADMAERARARGCYEEVLTGDILDPATVAGLTPGGFGFVLFGDVLEHLTAPETALRNIAPLLAFGGHILICVPSIIHWYLRLWMMRGRFEYTDTGSLDRIHVHFFTPKTAHNLVWGEGFWVVQEGGGVWLPSIVYRLPPKVRGALERPLARLSLDLVYGQSLLDVQRNTDVQRKTDVQREVPL